MCGITAGISANDVTGTLLEGLRRLEYRGYDSAGLALIGAGGEILRKRSTGRVAALVEEVSRDPDLHGSIGIAHTRWATHGKPTEQNAHPHICNETVSLVHNGIIENHESLRKQQEKLGYRFTSNTDTEVIVHQVHHNMEQSDNLFNALQQTVKELEGAYSLAVISNLEPHCLVVARQGSPLVIGVGDGETVRPGGRHLARGRCQRQKSEAARKSDQAARRLGGRDRPGGRIGHDSSLVGRRTVRQHRQQRL